MFFMVGMKEKSNFDFIDDNEIRFYNTKEYATLLDNCWELSFLVSGHKPLKLSKEPIEFL
jgi:hypothetical protein